MKEMHSIVIADAYRDSVFLMRLSDQAREASGADYVSAIMATRRNKELLGYSGLLTDEIEAARADDLIVIVDARRELLPKAKQAVLDLLNRSMSGSDAPAEGLPPKSLDKAVERLPDANLAVITVAGEYARYEAAQALSSGLDVFLYSDDISIEDELALKRLAWRKNLLLMGPNCGTAIVHDIPLGFANKVRQGPLGLVATTGTGIQEVGCLLDRCGLGISDAYGVGVRDADDRIGGLSIKTALRRLSDDADTQFIIVLAQFPGPATRRDLAKLYPELGKPVLVRYFGVEDYALEDAAGILHADSLTRVVTATVERIASILDTSELAQPDGADLRTAGLAGGMVRGIFSGGILCYEAMEQALPILGGNVHSNIRTDATAYLLGSQPSVGHSFLDMGSGEFTIGHPHPMLYPQDKLARIIAELCDPEVSVVLTDVVLGYGVTRNYAAELVKAVDKAAALTRGKSREKAVVVNVVGTESDQPGRSAEISLLRKSGIVVLGNNAQAAVFAANLVKGS